MAGRQSLKGETNFRKRSNLHCKSPFFQLSGRGHHLDDATPSFFLNSKSPILGLSNDISFVIFFLLEGG